MKTKALNFLILAIVLLVTPLTLSAETFRCVFKGKIANKNVHVVLNIDNNTDSFLVKGSYYYYNAKGQKISQDIKLNGHCDAKSPTRNYFFLSESFNGKYCGSWEANFNAETERMVGTITNSKGNQYDIDLRQIE